MQHTGYETILCKKIYQWFQCKYRAADPDGYTIRIDGEGTSIVALHSAHTVTNNFTDFESIY